MRARAGVRGLGRRCRSASGCCRSSPRTSPRTRSATRARARRSRSLSPQRGLAARAERRPTTAQASPRRTCRACSSASTAPTVRAPRAARGSGSRSSSTSSPPPGGTVEAAGGGAGGLRIALHASPRTWYDAARTMRPFNLHAPAARVLRPVHAGVGQRRRHLAPARPPARPLPEDGAELIRQIKEHEHTRRPPDARGRRPAQPHLRHAVRPRRHLPPRRRTRRCLRQRRRGRRQPRLLRRLAGPGRRRASRPT